MVCFRCGRAGHYANTCFAKTSVRGKRLVVSDDDDGEEDSSTEEDEENDKAGKYKRNAKRPHTATGQGGKYKRNAKRPHTTTGQGAGIYVLKTPGGLYYVGKSNNIDARIQEHRSGGGAHCLNGASFQEVTPLVTSGSASDLESWERNETLQRMKMHGIENVRGWMFTETTLSVERYQSAFHQICEKFDLCRRCGRASHFAQRCFATSVDAWAGNMPCL